MEATEQDRVSGSVYFESELCDTKSEHDALLRANFVPRLEQKRKDAKRREDSPRNSLRIFADLRVFALSLVAATLRCALCDKKFFTISVIEAG